MSEQKPQEEQQASQPGAESAAEDPRPEPRPETAGQEAGAAPGEPPAEPRAEPPVEPSAESSAEQEKDRIAELEAEAAELKDQLLRALAEAENVRRRAQRDRADAQKYAAAPMLRDLLAVADNLTRAIQSVPQGEPVEDERFKTLLAGIELTERELASVFQRHNVVKLEPLGEKMDPHRHEAMFEVPDPSTPNGTIVQVVEPGYMLHDRLIRPARVGVAKGGPAQAAPADDSAEAAGPEEPAQGGRVDTSA